jgi:hypothetical protein
MMATVHYDGPSSDPFPIKSGVKQGWVLAPTIFGIFFSLLLCYALHESEEGIFLHTRSDGSMFNLSCLRAKTKMHRVLIREMFFAGDAALAKHCEKALQRLILRFTDTCRELSLNINLKKTNILRQHVNTTLKLTIKNRSWKLWTNSPTLVP